MSDCDWNLRHSATIRQNVCEERRLRGIRGALRGPNGVDAKLHPVIPRDEIEYLIQHALLGYRLSPHVSLRAARDIALGAAHRPIEHHDQRGNDA